MDFLKNFFSNLFESHSRQVVRKSVCHLLVLPHILSLLVHSNTPPPQAIILLLYDHILRALELLQVHFFLFFLVEIQVNVQRR